MPVSYESASGTRIRARSRNDDGFPSRPAEMYCTVTDCPGQGVVDDRRNAPEITPASTGWDGRSSANNTTLAATAIPSQRGHRRDTARRAGTSSSTSILLGSASMAASSAGMVRKPLARDTRMRLRSPESGSGCMRRIVSSEVSSCCSNAGSKAIGVRLSPKSVMGQRAGAVAVARALA